MSALVQRAGRPDEDGGAKTSPEIISNGPVSCLPNSDE